MELDLNKLNWLDGTGPLAEIVITSRLRLARNLESIPFPPLSRDVDTKAVLEKVKQALSSEDFFKDFKTCIIPEMQPLDRHILVEEHLMSPALAGSGNNRAVIVSPDGKTSLMINEEDHIRTQCLLSGLQMEEAWQMADKVDNLLEKHLDFAFSEKLGYLTACPTNVGTALRASAMLHLPALSITNLMSRITSTIVQFGLAVRGIYGEGTEAEGHFYQISNQVSIGATEEDILAKITGVAKQIAEQELHARENLKKDVLPVITDKVWRTFGILKNAYMISTAEALELLSMTRLGTGLGILPFIPMKLLNELVIMIKPGYLQKLLGEDDSAAGRDIKRASLIREKLSPYNSSQI